MAGIQYGACCPKFIIVRWIKLQPQNIKLKKKTLLLSPYWRQYSIQLLCNNNFLPPNFKWLLNFPLLCDPQAQVDPAGRGVSVTIFRCVPVMGPWVRAVSCRAKAIDAACLLPIFEFSAPCGTHPVTSPKPLLRPVLCRLLKPKKQSSWSIIFARRVVL